MSRLATLAIALAASLLAEAGTYDNLKRKDENFTVHWAEKKSEIQYDLVCFRYDKGSVIYRNCRREAQILFRSNCASAKEKTENSALPRINIHLG